MTTINCSLNCIYQNDGKCNLDNTTVTSISFNPDCVYFSERIPGTTTLIMIANN